MSSARRDEYWRSAMARRSLETVSMIVFMQSTRATFCLLVSLFPSLILLILILFLLTEFMVMLRESAMTSLWLETLFSKPGSAVMVEKQSSGCNA